MSNTILSVDELLDLAQQLQHMGFGLDVRQVLSAQRLDSVMLALAADGAGDATQLRNLLAPVFCTSAEEQATFYTFFNDWLEAKPEVRERLGHQGSEEAGNQSALAPGRRRIRTIGVGAALVLLAAVIAIRYLGFTAVHPGEAANDLRLQVLHAVDETALPEAEVTYGGRSYSPDSDGWVDLVPPINPDSSLHVDIALDGFLPRRSSILALRRPASDHLYPEGREFELVGLAIDLESGRPLAGVNVELINTLEHLDKDAPVPGGDSSAVYRAQSDASGVFRFSLVPLGYYLDLQVEYGGYETVFPFWAGPYLTRKDTFYVELSQIKSPSRDSLNALVNRIRAYRGRDIWAATPEVPAWQQFLQDHKQEVQIAGIGLPALLLLTWFLIRLRRRRLLLERQSARFAPQVDRIAVQGIDSYLFRNTAFRRTVQQYRQHEEVASLRLNLQATVNATIDGGGLFAPVYASRFRLPAYLVLIDRTSFDDQYTRLLDGIVDRMAADGVVIDRYYFDGDPRICVPAKAGAARVNIADLFRWHPQHRLILFSDGQQLIDPLNGRPHPWLHAFLEWEQSAIFIPGHASKAAFLQRQFQSLGFRVGPADMAGLGDHIDRVLNPAQHRTSTTWDHARQYPELLEERLDRWLQRLSPGETTVDRLMDELTQFLDGERFDWLCACAIYPELHWELTLYLATRLTLSDHQALTDDEQHTLQQGLADLTRLPWFREGMMPDWLRLRLIAAMKQDRHDTVRGLLQDLLKTARENESSSGEGFELQYAQRSLKDVVLARLGLHPERRPADDYIFANYMSTRRPGRLSVFVPHTLQRLLYRRGQATLGIRPATGVLMAAFVALGALVSVEVLQPGLTSSNPDSDALFSDFYLADEADFAYSLDPIAKNTPGIYNLDDEGVLIALEQAHAALQNDLVTYAAMDTTQTRLLPNTADEARYLGDPADMRWVLLDKQNPDPRLAEAFYEEFYDYVSRQPIGRQIPTQAMTNPPLNDPVVPSAGFDLNLRIEGLPETAAAGDTLQWVLYVENAGPEIAYNINLYDYFTSADLEVIEVLNTQPEGSLLYSPLVWNRAELQAEGTYRIGIRARVRDGASDTISFSSEVVARGDRQATNNTVTTTVSIPLQSPPQQTEEAAVVEDPASSTDPAICNGKEYSTWCNECLTAGGSYVIGDGNEWVCQGATFQPLTLKDFVEIPAGTFVMGSMNGDGDEQPPINVTISQPFLLGRTEVTQAQWYAVMGTNPSRWKGVDLPVERVSWNDVQEFLDRLNKQSDCGNCYRLPTEAEWEYAARAGTTTAYSFGDDARDLGDYAWYNENANRTYRVATKRSNPWGLYDMHGNVWEWVQDWYASDMYEQYGNGTVQSGNGTVTDPLGAPSGSYRVIRGGSWYSMTPARPAVGGSPRLDSPGGRSTLLGFRLVRTYP